MAGLWKQKSGLIFLAALGLAMTPLATARAALPGQPRYTAPTPPPVSGIHLTRVQLGAWRTAIEAAKGWDIIQKRAGGAMDGLSPRVVPATLPGRGTFYRLWVGPVLKASAGRLCAQLQSRRIDCIQAPNDTPAAVPHAGVYQANEKP